MKKSEEEYEGQADEVNEQRRRKGLRSIHGSMATAGLLAQGWLGNVFGLFGGLEKPEEVVTMIGSRIAKRKDDAPPSPLGAMCDPWARKQRERKRARKGN